MRTLKNKTAFRLLSISAYGIGWALCPGATGAASKLGEVASAILPNLISDEASNLSHEFIREKWFNGENGILNSDIQLCLADAVIETLKDIKIAYKPHDRHGGIASLVDIWINEVEQQWKTPKGLGENHFANKDALDILVKARGEYSSDKLIEQLPIEIEGLKNDHFKEFLKEKFLPGVDLHFYDIIHNNQTAFNKISTIFQKEAKEERKEIKHITQEILSILQNTRFSDPQEILLHQSEPNAIEDLSALDELQKLRTLLAGVNSTLLNHEKILYTESDEEIKLHLINEIKNCKTQLGEVSNTISKTINAINSPIAVAGEVERYLEIIDHHYDTNVILNTKTTFDFKTNIKGKETIIACIDRTIDTEDVTAILSNYPDSEHLMIVSKQKVNPGLVEEFNQEERLRMFSLSTFVVYLYEFEEYFQYLVTEYEESKLPKEYIDLKCINPKYNDRGEHLQNAYHESSEDFIMNWMKNSSQNHLSILGDFGTGKTWLSWYFSNKQLKSYNKFAHSERIPILIILRKFADCNSWEEIVERFIANHNINLTSDSFQELNRLGKLLIIFDGFDELSSNQGGSFAKANFVKLSPLVTINSKVLLTSRKTYFKSELDESDSLNIEGNKSENVQEIDLGHLLRFGTIHLKEFSPLQIKAVLEKKVPEKLNDYWPIIESRDYLLDLARRPVMLDMILDSLPKLDLTRRINEFDLYDTYVNGWISKVSEGRSLISPEAKRRMVNELAWKMYKDKNLEIHYSKLIDLIKNKEITTALTADELQLELTNQSFLIRNKSGYFYFAHKSFLEFIVADKLKNDIDNNHFQSFKDNVIIPEVLRFLSYLDIQTEHLIGWISTAREYHLKDYLIGNILSLLKRINYDFRNFDFSELTINNADFAGVDLSGSNFKNANINSINLRDAILVDTNFENAGLFDLKLGVRSPAKGVEGSDPLNLIASCNGENQIVLIDGDTLDIIEKLDGHSDSVTSVFFNKSCKFLASASFDNSVIIWKMDEKDPFIYRRIKVNDTIIYDACVTPDNKLVITSDNHSRVKIWDIKTEMEIASLEAHDSTVYNIDIHPQGKYIASASFDKTVILWKVDLSSREPVISYKRLRDHIGLVNGITFSPCGNYLATSSNDKSVKVWDVESGESLYTLNGHEGVVWSVCFHPNGRYLASSSSDKNIILWDLENRKPHVVLEGHESEVWNVSFLKNGKYIVSGGFDDTVRVWDWEENKCVKTIDLLKDVNQKIDCSNMILDGVVGLSDLQLRFLLSKGATKKLN